MLDLDPTITKLDQMLDGFLASLPNVVFAIVLFVVLYIVSRLVRRTIQEVVTRSGAGAYAGIVFGRVTQWVIVLVAMLVAVSVVFPSVNAQTLVSVLGLGSLAIGFAFRDIAQNFLAGMLILFTRPFKIGDQIVINDFEGTVQDIETRATTIRTYDGRIVVVPNADFLTETVIVNTAFDVRRTEYDIGISYSDDIDLAKRLILEVLHETEGVLDVPAPDVLTVELAASSVNLRARWWTRSVRSDVMVVTDQVVTGVKKKLEAAGITIPFPITTLHFEDGAERRGARQPF